jgi:two-component system, NarL family, response regulator YdfI
MKKICTLIVAAHPTVRAGLAALLRQTEEICLQGEVPDAGDALARMLPDLSPDAVLFDLAGSDCFSHVLDAVRKTEPTPALVILGDNPSRDVPRLQSAETLAGWGYLPRDTEPEILAAALRAAALGLSVQSSHLASKSGAVSDVLTPREIEVLGLIALGLPNKIIAYRLGITLHTAKFHVAQILAKLDATSRTEAVTLGARRGLVAF